VRGNGFWHRAAATSGAALVAPRHPWDDATLEALASILADVHAIEPRASLT
jgi:hypothetical protein